MRVLPDFRIPGLNFDSLANLSISADRTFVAAAYQLDTLLQSNQRARGSLKDTNFWIQELSNQEKKLQATLAKSNANEIRAAREKLKTVKSWESEWNSRTKIMNDATKEFHQRSDLAAQNIVQWLSVAAPPKARLMPSNLLAVRKKAKDEPKVELMKPVDIVAIRPAAVAQPIRKPAYRANPPGHFNNKIAAIDLIIPSLAKAKTDSNDLHRERTNKEHTLSNLRRRIGTLETAARVKSAPLVALEKKIKQADDNWSSAAFDGPRKGRNLLNAAIETYILETFFDGVVVPKVTKFLSENGYTKPLDNSMIGEMYRSGKFLFSSTMNRYQSLERMIEVAKQAKEVVNDFMSYAPDVAAANASPNNATAIGIIRDKDGLLERQTWSLMEAAVGKSGPLAQISRKMLMR